MRKKYLFLVMAICVSSCMMFGCKKKTADSAATVTENVATSSDTKIGENYISSQNPFTSTDIGNIGKIKLVDYSDVHVTLTDWYGDVSESDVDSYINNLLADNLVDVDRASEKGDTVVVDYTGTIDGKEFDGNAETDYSVELGAGQMLSDFENALYGVKAGDVVTATVNFPDDYNAEEVAGKTAIFQVTVKAVQTKPELNEEFISKFTKVGATTTDEFKKEVRNVIQVYYQKQNELMGIEAAIDQIADESDLEPSDAFLQYLHDYYYDSMERYLSDSDMTMDEYKEYTNMSDADIDKQIEDAMRVSMMSAKCIDIPAFVKAIGLMRQEDRYLLDGFMKSYSIYQYKFACFEASSNEQAADALERVFNKLLGVNAWYKSHTEDSYNNNEGDTIFMKRIRSVVDKEAAVEDIRRYMTEYTVRLSLYMGDDHYEDKDEQ